MSRSRAIVVGGGFGGMAAALRLCARGYAVLVVDCCPQLGGRAQVFERDGFRHDAGPTIITASLLFEELFALFGKRLQDYVQLVKLNPWYRFRFPDGSYFNYGGSVEDTLAEIERLPCGSNSFLCKSPIFRRDRTEWGALEKELAAWLDEHASSGWRLLRRQSASLPMAPPPPEGTQGRVFPGGTRGGSIRISTGYAFHRIQRWANQCASSILATGVPVAPRRNALLDGMDELFLRVLQQPSVSADDLFGQMFERCPPDALVRFLSSMPQSGDLWLVAHSLPWGRFLEAGPSFASAWVAKMRESH